MWVLRVAVLNPILADRVEVPAVMSQAIRAGVGYSTRIRSRFRHAASFASNYWAVLWSELPPSVHSAGY